MRFKNYLLLEKTFNVDKDVDLLYNKGYKKLFDILNKYDLEDDIEKIQGELNKFFKNGFNSVFLKTDSSILKTKDAKAAHTVNPVDIIEGIFREGSSYRPAETIKATTAAMVGKSAKGVITISLTITAFEFYMTLTRLDQIPKDQVKYFKNEFTPDRIKGAIAHELSHWISDSKHNFYITKVLKVTRELDKPEMMLLHKKDVNMTHFELDAQIHAIKNLKANHKKEWDKFSLVDVFERYTSLYAIGKGLYDSYGKKVLNIWQKALVKRMAREKLLGKNMKNFVKPTEL